MRRHTPGPRAAVAGIRRVSGPQGFSAQKAVSLGQGQQCYLAPQVLMFFPSTASSTRETW